MGYTAEINKEGRRITSGEGGRGGGKKLLFIKKRKRFSGKELRREFQMAWLKSVPFTTR